MSSTHTEYNEKAPVEKKRKRDHRENAKNKKAKRTQQDAKEGVFSLLVDEKAVDPTLSSLFTQKPTVPQPKPAPLEARDDFDEGGDQVRADTTDDVGFDRVDDVDDALSAQGVESQRRRKRKRNEYEVEDAYMHRLEQEEARDAKQAAFERSADHQISLGQSEDLHLSNGNGRVGSERQDEDEDDEPYRQAEDAGEIDEEAISPPPKHETEQATEDELAKANRTVFLGNVSTAAVSSNTARKTLINHLKSVFESMPKQKDGELKHRVESIRFRSTPYASAIPKKAAFATKQVMDATAKSTNAYAVYSSQALSRHAAKQLNGTIVLGRHLRVDEVAHPAKVDNKRCVFVGNLGFVDDESNIQTANEEEGKEKRKPSKQPADVEEGLWRTFGKCGVVESVRVIRDSTTRVGKGIAYVQFEDANAVEAALLYDEKKFPPLLPRKLRISRAKVQKRNARVGSGRQMSNAKATGYQRKISGEEASKLGRTGKLYGRAAAAQAKRASRSGDVRQSKNDKTLADGMRKPEDFVFEGHRASSTSGKTGLKGSGGKGKRGGKVTQRSKAFKVKKKSK